MKNFDKEEFLITLENKLSNLLVNNTLSVNELCYEFRTFAILFVEIATVLFYILEAPLANTTRLHLKHKIVVLSFLFSLHS